MKIILKNAILHLHGGIIMNRNLKILVVEDEETSQMLASELLENLGCEVDIANNGSEGVRFYEDKDYDLVFVDLKMFDMDGFNVGKKITSCPKRKAKKTPMIVLSICEGDNWKKRAKQLGFQDYLVKPLTEQACQNVFDKYVPDTSDTKH
jgi:two-component system, sensor histidine kinase and response regulator